MNLVQVIKALKAYFNFSPDKSNFLVRLSGEASFSFEDLILDYIIALDTIKNLNPVYKAIIIYRAMDYNYYEISLKLKIDIKTIKRYIVRMARNLAKY